MGKKRSALEIRFAKIWEALGGHPLQEEYRFHPERKWRADFACEQSRILIEIEGGVWGRGRHLTPSGFIKDAEKYLSATLQGWIVIRLVGSQLNPATIRNVLDYARSRISGQTVV